MSNYRCSGFVCGESVASVQDMFVLAGGHFEALVIVRINKYLVCVRVCFYVSLSYSVFIYLPGLLIGKPSCPQAVIIQRAEGLTSTGGILRPLHPTSKHPCLGIKANEPSSTFSAPHLCTEPLG